MLIDMFFRLNHLLHPIMKLPPCGRFDTIAKHSNWQLVWYESLPETYLGISAGYFPDSYYQRKSSQRSDHNDLPNDLDINLHVNNGRYLTLCDLGRIDLFLRSGLARVMLKEKWFPVVGNVTMTFIKPLHVFNRIRISSTVTHWDEKYFYSTHTIYRGDVVVSTGTSKSLVVSRLSGRVTPDVVIGTVNRALDRN